MRISLIISSLKSGGAERVLSNMATYWVEKKHDVSMITLDSRLSDFYELHPEVKRYDLDVMDASTSMLDAAKNNLLRIKKLRSAIVESKPEVVISFMDVTNVLTLLSTRGLGIRVIVSERSVPAHYPIENAWLKLRSMTYSLADVVVAQTSEVGRWIEDNMKCKKVVVIPNPIHLGMVTNSGVRLLDVIGAPTKAPTIIAMGRMTNEKGFDLLIKSFSMVASSYPDWRLVIFGEGQERNKLTSLAKDLGVSDRVFMPGLMKNPAHLLREADIFVLSSRFEGFPNVLLEAMACGLPVISFDCPSGPGEIIRDGVDGLLVPPEDVGAMAKTMDRLMADERERVCLKARAPEVCERFSMDKVMGMWEALF